MNMEARSRNDTNCVCVHRKVHMLNHNYWYVMCISCDAMTNIEKVIAFMHVDWSRLPTKFIYGWSS